jgi:5'-3' exonuclease
MNKERLLDIFSRLGKEDKEQSISLPANMHFNSRVLLIDGMNTFLRGFAVVNKMNTMGNEIGGMIGFLRSVGHAIKLLSPTRVIIIFDGEAGSTNRKYLYSNYKANREHGNIMNRLSFATKDEEEESKYNQLERLIDYLSLLPITLISMDKLEADDIIGYLSQHIYAEVPDSEQFIMSSDNDFLQLVNDRVKAYSPTKKKIYHIQDVMDEFGIHPNNFLLFKTLIGDDSDNIPGVSGFGKVNTPKLFEFMQHEEPKDLKALYEICENPTKKSVLYDRILNTKRDVEIFYKIMNLKNPNISEEEILEIQDYFKQRPTGLKKMDFMRLYQYDKMGDAINNLDTWLNIFNILNSYQQKG